MACINCPSCNNATPKVPNCFTGSVILGTVAAVATEHYVEFAKGNGAMLELSATSDGAGLLSVDFSTLTDPEWFAPGYYVVTVLDLNRNEVTITDAAGPTAAECLVIEIIDVEQAGNADITLVYDV